MATDCSQLPHSVLNPFKQNGIYQISTPSQSISTLPKNLVTYLKKQKIPVGYILTDSTFIPYLSTFQNIKLSLKLAKPKLRNSDFLILDALEEMNISYKLAHKPIQELTATQLKEVQLISAIFSGKKIIIVDSWIEFLSETEQLNWLLIFKNFVKDRGVTFILLTNSNKIAEQSDDTFHEKDFHLNSFDN
ncbi:hypothetical protein CKN82_01620 [Carnobacterium divergens]|uniref:ABC transporter domain-containing protein n=1 Tax=Carnobacterium divergens TaxID=2748 RepID=A0AAW8R912_CARDV|nr:hypothetical protein [Carnobacterium divergens]ANZ99402.1 hypothetical protein BFC22_04475 [Carnobacterium divergens]MDT1958175.1 hypothetical protein [Carnobacterium divergens]MDT1973442.1 hypothetical protein [Carnobacterium divergens]MDT1995822.1 hypothetical protein [Carnobacterium divergens]TFI68445.1 hypothetical protein CKN59_01760 [Carnobacterium divergens]